MIDAERISSALEPPEWLTFDRHHHVYFIDGAPLKSVTEVLVDAGLTPDYDSMHPAVWRNVVRAGWRSDILHRLFCEVQLGLCDPDEIPPEVQPQAVKLLKVMTKHSFDPIALERRLASRRLWLGGTSDFVGYVDGTFGVADVKGTAKLNERYVRLQLAAYVNLVCRTAARAGLTLDPRRIPTWVVHVPKNGPGRLVPMEPDHVGFDLLYGEKVIP